MTVALLDVNVLIALVDPQHEMHDAAHAWFEANSRHGWATCPITENGCLRILAKLYISLRIPLPRIAEMLQLMCSLEGHHFWPDRNSILEPGRFDLSIINPKTLTDAYLLDAACANGGRLVTFDRSIALKSVVEATPENLEIL